jgi:hypothetical protein
LVVEIPGFYGRRGGFDDLLRCVTRHEDAALFERVNFDKWASSLFPRTGRPSSSLAAVRPAA